MDRRTFVAGAVASLAAPYVAEAQRPERPRIGWLTSSVIHQRNVDAFRQGMRALGYGEVALEFRTAAGQGDRLPALAAELVALPVDIIITDGGQALVAAKQATTTVPIVIGATAADVVRQGVVASLARPGGNITGFTISTGGELYGKRLELLREALPGVARVAVVWNPGNEWGRLSLPSIGTAAKALGLEHDVIGARDADELERAISGTARRRVGAMLTVADAFFWSQRSRIVAVATRQRLPAVYPETEFVEAGGLMAYGPNVPDNFRRAAGYVDKILKGTNPGDLPIELPAKFELAINLKTARALTVTIPPSLLLRADQVIE